MDKKLILMGNIWMVGGLVKGVDVFASVMVIFGIIVTILGLFALGEQDE